MTGFSHGLERGGIENKTKMQTSLPFRAGLRRANLDAKSSRTCTKWIDVAHSDWFLQIADDGGSGGSGWDVTGNLPMLRKGFSRPRPEDFPSLSFAESKLILRRDVSD